MKENNKIYNTVLFNQQKLLKNDSEINDWKDNIFEILFLIISFKNNHDKDNCKYVNK